MTEYLLISEAFIKDSTPIFGNINGKYILTAIREAQEVRIKGVLGTALLGKLKALIKEGAIEEHSHYKDLLERCQMAIAYQAIAELARLTSYKITNKGVVRTTDERVESVTESEIIRTQDFYKAKADGYIHELQLFLVYHSHLFPELTASKCSEIRATLNSAASCGLWLGGFRGKKIR